MKVNADLDKKMAKIDFSDGLLVNEVPELKKHQKNVKQATTLSEALLNLPQFDDDEDIFAREGSQYSPHREIDWTI